MNWKTTLFGLIAAVFGFILFSPTYFPAWMVDLAKYVTVGGLAGLGITAKDSNTHSTQAEVVQSTADANQKAIGAAQK